MSLLPQKQPPQQVQPASAVEPDAPPQQDGEACSVAVIPVPQQQQQAPAVVGAAGLAPLDAQWQDSASTGCSGIATATSSTEHLVATAKRIISSPVAFFQVQPSLSAIEPYRRAAYNP